MMSTGSANLDAMLGGGLPRYSLNVLAGRPGSGKTVLAQQLAFHHVAEDQGARALYLTTLSEPAIKVVRYMQGFAFFDVDAFGERVRYHDIAPLFRHEPIAEVGSAILALVEEHDADLLIIDSFKAIRDLCADATSFRQLVFHLSVQLASARCTSILVGEYHDAEVREGAEFAVADAPVELVQHAMEGMGFLPGPFQESGQLVIEPAFHEGAGSLDLSDPEAFLFALQRRLDRMPRPLRLVFDSLTPLALGYAPAEFVRVVHRKVRRLRRPDVAILDTLLHQMLQPADLYSLMGAYDVVLDLYTPDWGEMRAAGAAGGRVLQVRKTRGAHADGRPHPYAIVPGEGIVLRGDYYASSGGGG